MIGDDGGMTTGVYRMSEKNSLAMGLCRSSSPCSFHLSGSDCSLAKFLAARISPTSHIGMLASLMAYMVTVWDLWNLLISFHTVKFLLIFFLFFRKFAEACTKDRLYAVRRRIKLIGVVGRIHTLIPFSIMSVLSLRGVITVRRSFHMSLLYAFLKFCQIIFQDISSSLITIGNNCKLLIYVGGNCRSFLFSF